jgi:hypothetical protein
MVRPLFACLATTILLGFSSAPSARAETLTYPDLVHRLTDLKHLATPPQAGEQGALASSYDRASIYDAATDTYHHWDANGDGGGIIRKEGDESVLMEVQGPGCIWRTWSATTAAGHVKIYLDGESSPTVDLPFTGYFDHSSEPFTRPHLVYKTASNGWDNFTPIPFLKSCKIVADKGWGSYYHFNYTRFAPGTIVPTFKLPLSAEDNAALDAADKILGKPGANPVGTQPGEQTQKADLTIPAGEKAVVADLNGPGAVTALKVKFPLPADPEEQKNLLRQLTISIVWDDDKEPSVWAPLGDFFADAVMPVKYRNLVTGITDDGQWYCYWYMPYSSHAHIQVQNESPAPLVMNWEVTLAPISKSTADGLLRFHAKWHRDTLPAMRPDRLPDWTLLKTQGTGRYVGTQLHLWNPRGGWWGEGDEKWFVDGEKFPSTIGTGSEDYFGFAWSSGHPFTEPLHGQPVNEGNHGHASLYRWHIADNIPFHTGFEGAIEKYFPNSRPTLYDAVAFWYLAPGGTDSYAAIPVADRIGYWTTPPPVPEIANLIVSTVDPNEEAPAKDPEIIEGESMHPTVGDAQIQGMGGAWGHNWSGNAQLWWTANRVEAHSENEFQGPKAGKYRLTGRFTQAKDYGIVQISINGTKAGGPIDLYGENVKATSPIDLGMVEIKDGTNILGMDIVGTRKGGCYVGVDYIKLTPVP